MRCCGLALSAVVAVLTFLSSTAFAAPPRQIPLPALRVIVPAEFVASNGLRELLYRRLTNRMLAQHPECGRFRAYHRLTPLATTAVVTVRCIKFGRTEV